MTALTGFLSTVVKEIVNPLILLLSAVALVVFAWGVFELVYRSGDEKARAQGRQAMFWGLIGFVVIFGAYGILNLALATFGLGTIEQSLPPNTPPSP